LTNRRGQVVAASWLTAEFPTAQPTFVTVQQHGAARDALRALGLDRLRANPRPVAIHGLQELIGPSVEEAQKMMRQVFKAAEDDVSQRIEAWNDRLDQWDQKADAMPQLPGLKQRRVGVNQERELVAAMAPDRQLVRPLVVVVAEEGR